MKDTAPARLFELLIGIGLLAMVAGCQSEPPPRVAIPDRTGGNPYATSESAPNRPMPPQEGNAHLPPPPYADAPLVHERPPEEHDYIVAYEKVGRPHIAVLLNPQLKEGSEDELRERSIDYAAMETILEDWLGADGHVTLISPSAARQRLSGQQVQSLQSGSANAAQRVGDDLAADVVVEVRVEPTRQAGEPAARLLADAVNVRGGQSIGRALVDVPPPLNAAQIDQYTRLVARKLMDEMTKSWITLQAATVQAPAAPPPPPVAPSPPPAPAAPAPPPPAPAAPPPATVK